MSNIKDGAKAIFEQHIALATTDPKLFRKTVLNQIVAEFGVSMASAATAYNNVKKAAVPIEGLGRAVNPNVIRKTNKHKVAEVKPDEECFSIIELLRNKDGVTVGRTRSYEFQGEASEAFDERAELAPVHTWVMIQGLGPMPGENYKLGDKEAEIKRYTPAGAEPIEEKLMVDPTADADEVADAITDFIA